MGLEVGFIRVVGFFVAAASTWLAVSTLGGSVPVSPLFISVVVVIFVVSFVVTFEVSSVVGRVVGFVVGFVVGLVVDLVVDFWVVVVFVATLVGVGFVVRIIGLMYFVVLVGFSVVVDGIFRIRGSFSGLFFLI